MGEPKKYRHVGVAQIYPWRPHGSQRDYLLRLTREAGYETSELVCDGSTVKCYDKQYQTLGWGGLDHCVKCRLGAGRERHRTRRFVLDWSSRDVPVEGEELAMLSNRAALVRAELSEDIVESVGEMGLLQAYRVGFHSTLRWIEACGIDLILLFNGRIDILKGVMDATRFAGVDFASYERSWFGSGIMLLPNESCLGLKSRHNLVSATSAMQLTSNEEASAERIIRSRVERSGSNEWRDFQVQSANLNHDVRDTLGGRPEVLVLPSSRYEVWGHPDWETGWRDNFEAMDWLQAQLNIPWSRWLIRGHPIWSQRVGRSLGENATRHYRQFCKRRGIRYVEADSPVPTSTLIEASELVVLNGGSSVIEAVWRGKPVVSLGQSTFRYAGICPTALSPDDSVTIPDDATRRRQLVRFIHGMDRLMPTFVDHLVPISPAQQMQYEGADFQDIIDQVRFNTLLSPGKNKAPVGEPIQRPPNLIERTRGFFRVGDR